MPAILRALVAQHVQADRGEPGAQLLPGLAGHGVVLQDQALDVGPALLGGLVDEVVLAALAVHLDQLDGPAGTGDDLVEGDRLDADAGTVDPVVEGEVVVTRTSALQVEDREPGLTGQRLLVRGDPVGVAVDLDVRLQELEGVRRRLEAVHRGARVDRRQVGGEGADVRTDVKDVDRSVDQVAEEPAQVVAVLREDLVDGDAGARGVRDRDRLPGTGVEGQHLRALRRPSRVPSRPAGRASW